MQLYSALLIYPGRAILLMYSFPLKHHSSVPVDIYCHIHVSVFVTSIYYKHTRGLRRGGLTPAWAPRMPIVTEQGFILRTIKSRLQMRQYSKGVPTLKHTVSDKEKRNTGIRCITATNFVIRHTMNSTSMQHQQKQQKQQQQQYRNTKSSSRNIWQVHANTYSYIVQQRTTQ